MIMQLTYPAPAVIFYAALLEYVTFDIIPSEQIYNLIFDFNEDADSAYSDEADSIGYSSRYFIKNSGSVPIYMVLICLT